MKFRGASESNQTIHSSLLFSPLTGVTTVMSSSVAETADMSSTPDMPAHNRTPEVLQGLNSTKQNMELFKLLTAISLEIHQLQQTTESRLSKLETMMATMNRDDASANNPNNLNESSGSNAPTLHSTSNLLGQSKGELIANSMIANWQLASSEAAAAGGGGSGNSNGDNRRDNSADTNRSSSNVNEVNTHRPDIDVMLQKNKALNMPVNLKIGGSTYEVILTTYSSVYFVIQTTMHSVRPFQIQDACHYHSPAGELEMQKNSQLFSRVP